MKVTTECDLALHSTEAKHKKEETVKPRTLMIQKSKCPAAILMVAAVALAATPSAAQTAPSVHGSGTTNTFALWTNSSTIGPSNLTQSGNNISLPGTLGATGLNCPACVGNAQLSINYAASSTKGGDANNALNLGALPPSAFAQRASDNSFTGKNSFAGNVSIGLGLQFNGTPLLTIGGLESSLYVGLNDGVAPGNTGNFNTAIGQGALSSNTTGGSNTATGANALGANTTGDVNTAGGYAALSSNTTGSGNTASGLGALFSNTTGDSNTAHGYTALYHNTTGKFNTAIGSGALLNTTASRNTAIGGAAGFNLQSGSSNIMVGIEAGLSFESNESNNIDIGNLGKTGDGTATNSGVIRIGTDVTQDASCSIGCQTATYIAGINGAIIGSGGSTVLVDSNGQLGIAASSRRYKEDINDMGTASDGLLRLRPVTFRYKKPYADGSKPVQYGLVAEEVADVYPDLVVRGKDGQPETVQYYKLDAMLLNEVQKLAKQHAADQAAIANLQAEIAEQRKKTQEQDAAMKQLESQFRVIRRALSETSWEGKGQ